MLSLSGDDALVAQIRHGNEPAFEVAFERHGPGLLSFCRHMLGSRDAAEDAVQQTFASAYDALVRDEREIRLKPWLYTIARNRCLSVLRRRREDLVEEPVVETVGLHQEVQGRADVRELLADIAELPPQQRAALVLSELGDLSHSEIADVLGVETPKVKALVFRARSGLIDRREARATPCRDVRERLANLRGGALRSRTLKHHLRGCAGCSAYLEEVRRQRRMLSLMLPVVPGVGLKRGVLAAAGLSGGSAGGGAAAGGVAGSATLAKVATAAVLAGGTGAVGGAALDSSGGGSDRHADAPAASPAPAPLRHDSARRAAALPRHRAGAPRDHSAGARPHAPAKPATSVPEAARQGQVAPAPRGSHAKAGHVPSKEPRGRSGPHSPPGHRANPPKRPAAPRRGGLRALGSPAPKGPAGPKALHKKD